MDSDLFALLLPSLLFTALSPISVRAQGSDTILSQETIEKMKQEGQLFSIHIALENPVRIFIVGKEEAKFDPAKLSLTVRRLKPYPGKILGVDRFDNYFLINDMAEFKKTTDLEIITKINNKNEVFKFKLKKKTLP